MEEWFGKSLGHPGDLNAMTRTRPRLGVFKFASCDGCQLSLLDCEDQLLAVADRVEIAYFLEATRRPLEGEFDVALVEGSVSTPGQEEEIRDIRRRTRFLITLGACASDGGIQGLRNFGSLNVERALAIVYASPQYVETLAHSRPASALRARRPRAAGLPDQQGAAPRGFGTDARRRPAQGTKPRALPGLQAAAPRVRPGGPRRPVHGAGHVHRLRGSLPKLRSALLQLLWAERPAQHDGARPAVRATGARAGGDQAALPHVLRQRTRVQGGRRCAMPDQPPDEVIEGNATARSGERLIRVAALARVEGEGALTIRLRDGRVDDVQLRIFEAPRFFEAFLRGRAIAEVPDITARICGICPVAYQMSACHALEALLGFALPDPLRALRRLLYCGEWIESHVLHIAFLHAPDFLGYESAIAMAQDRPEYAEKVRDALKLKKAGNAIVDLVGGRAIHPINVKLGGFYRIPGQVRADGLGRAVEAGPGHRPGAGPLDRRTGLPAAGARL